ncbi:MAG: hypothetical protein FWE57_11355 [Chitinispirillia bacterium]|nr:hypothetical protein [Chitinispirillia bacterium]
MAWREPRTDWIPGGGIKASDFNRIEGNIEYLASPSFTLKGMLPFINHTGLSPTKAIIIDALPVTINGVNKKVVTTLQQMTAEVSYQAGHTRCIYQLIIGLLPSNFFFKGQTEVDVSIFRQAVRFDIPELVNIASAPIAEWQNLGGASIALGITTQNVGNGALEGGVVSMSFSLVNNAN